MSTHLRALLMGSLDELRHEPIAKRIRATMGDETVVDTTRGAARLGAEARRAVLRDPRRRHRGRDRRGAGRLGGVRVRRGRPAAPRAPGPRPERPVLGPHRRRRAGDASARAAREATGFRAADPEIGGHVILAFEDFDAWYEEDERNVSHPRDPFHRIDFVHSSRHVRVERDGQVLAESSRPVLRVRAAAPRALLPARRGRAHRPPRAERHGARGAPTRARRRTGRCPTSTTSPGSTPRRCARRGRSRTGSRSSTSTPTSPSTGARSSGRSRPGRAARARLSGGRRRRRSAGRRARA